MKILVACEESQRVCLAFRNKGHEAYSADIQDCSGGYPEYHIKGDVLKILDNPTEFITQDKEYHYINKWDMIIAHPPCTYLSLAGNRSLYKNGTLNSERYHKGIKAAEFFNMFYNANCEKICVENPLANSVFGLPKYTQIIHPYYFGEPFKKRTCLWLKGLPPLQKTSNLTANEAQATIDSVWFNRGSNRQKNRSKTFVCIAEAMAEQWG